MSWNGVNSVPVHACSHHSKLACLIATYWKQENRLWEKEAGNWNLVPGELRIGDLQGNQGAADGASRQRRMSNDKDVVNK